MSDGVSFPAVMESCRRKAQNASRTRRIPDCDGNFATVQPEPKLTAETVLRVMLDAFGHCCWCHVSCWINGTLEHVTRVADGGTNDFANLAWACLSCNRKGYYR